MKKKKVTKKKSTKKKAPKYEVKVKIPLNHGNWEFWL